MNVARRIFTDQQIDLMRRQSQGEFSMHRLEKMLKASRESIIPHMVIIGLEPSIQPHNKGGQRAPSIDMHPRASDAMNASPSVGKDKLLLRLQTLHANRRYGEPILPLMDMCDEKEK